MYWFPSVGQSISLGAPISARPLFISGLGGNNRLISAPVNGDGDASTMKRVAQWIASLFGWEAPAGSPSDAAQAALRDRHRRRIDEASRALAAATRMRDLLRDELDALRQDEARLQAQVRSAALAGDEPAGAQTALELHNVSTQIDEVRPRFEAAAEKSEQLRFLRDEAIAKARAELKEASTWD